MRYTGGIVTLRALTLIITASLSAHGRDTGLFTLERNSSAALVRACEESSFLRRIMKIESRVIHTMDFQ